MVNQAIHQMVCDAHGEEAWNRIRQAADCQVEHFLRMDSYPDDLTYRLVSAAVGELQIQAPLLLYSLGEYWIGFARTSGYSDFFDACDSYTDFICQLDSMHARLELAFPNFNPPQFSCHIRSQEVIEVIYRSSRAGLAPFVRGLLVGLGKVFGVAPNVVQLDDLQPNTARTENRFLVTLSKL